MNKRFRAFSFTIVVALILGLLSSPVQMGPTPALAANPGSGTLVPPPTDGSVSVTWTGGPYTVATPDRLLCVSSSVNCDRYTLTFSAPANYWDNHEGSVTFEINWASRSDDFDMYILDSTGKKIQQSAAGGTNSERVSIEKLPPGTYTVQVAAYLVAGASYNGSVTLTTTTIPAGMTFPETKDTVKNLLTVDYPLNIIFVGYHPSAAEVAELKSWTPDNYQPTVAQKSPGGDELQNSEAGLLNWNKNHLIDNLPYFLGIRYNYRINVIQASDDYARALFAVAQANTAQAQSFHASSRGQDLARYNTLYGQYRVLAKNGDASYAVTDPTKTDLVDAYAVEDWIFNSRYDVGWSCAFRNLETSACLNPSIIQPDPTAYHDPFYDHNGLNLDHMPQGANAGSSFFFLDTFPPSYTSTYFRSNAYHTWGTDKVINGGIVPSAVEQGGSWRITDPDSGNWDGVDFARTWGGRYRSVPRGDVYWLAVSNWTDFYSRPQWVNGQLTNLPWYGTWWTNTDRLYKINFAGSNDDDVLRWLSSALPYARWVGRKGESIPIYDPTSNQPTGRTLDTSPKYEDLPAPKYHVHQGATEMEVVPEPLYPGDDHQEIRQYGSSTVNL